jgi:RND family efflux transporter MFP subunit
MAGDGFGSKIGLLTIVASVLGVGAWLALRSPAGDRAPPLPPIVVSVATVTRRDVDRELSAVGTVQPLINVTVRPQIDGVLTQVLVHEGQHVERGQLLAQIDDRALAAAVAQARAEQARNVANLGIAELDRKRDENLLAEQAISRQTVEQQRAVTEQLKATIQSNAAAARAAEIQQSYAHIQSPVTGKVGMRRVDPGNLVHANDSGGLFTVVQVDPISVVFAMPEPVLPRLRELLKQSEGTQVVVLDRALGTPLATGRLLAADNQVDAATGTIQMRALFANPHELLWPGEFVTVRVRTSTDHDVLTVDSRAVQHGLEGEFVFRVRDGVAEAVPVTVLYQEDSLATLSAGPNAGDLVVIEGQDQLKSGSPVKVTSTSAAAMAGPALVPAAVGATASPRPL